MERRAYRIAFLHSITCPGSYADQKRAAFPLDGRSEAIVLGSLQMGEYYGADAAITPSFSTRLNFAGKATAGYNSQKFGLNFIYEHIDPEYATMGAYFFNNDIENYTVSPHVCLCKREGPVVWVLRFATQQPVGQSLRDLLAQHWLSKPEPQPECEIWPGSELFQLPHESDLYSF